MCPPTDNPFEDIVYNDSIDMSIFFPVGKQQQQEVEAVKHKLCANDPMSQPIVDWFFTQRLENFIKHWHYETLGAKWHWFRYEYQGRGSIHCHGTAKLKNYPGLCQLSETALKGFLAHKFEDENDYSDTIELDQDIEAGHRAAETVRQYVDWLLSTINSNPPDEDIWIGPEDHPCRRPHKDISEHEKQSDYEDFVNMARRHTRCGTSDCLRKKANEEELKCRFHFSFEHRAETKLEFEKFTLNMVIIITGQRL